MHYSTPGDGDLEKTSRVQILMIVKLDKSPFSSEEYVYIHSLKIDDIKIIHIVS